MSESDRLCFSMRILLLSTLFSFFCLAAKAQSPPSAYAPTTNPGSSNFVMGDPVNAKHNQTLYPPDLTDLRSGPITMLFFKYGSTSSVSGNTIDSLRISLGQTDSLNLKSSGSFSAAFMPARLLTRVYTRGLTVIPAGTQDAWFALTLDTPFLYDSARTLIVDILFNSSTNQVFGVRTEGVSSSRSLRVYTDRVRDTTGSTSSSVPHLGFSFITATRPQVASLGLALPNPISGSVPVALPSQLQGKELVVLDPSGKAVHREILGAQLRLTGLVKGLYLLKVENRTQRVVVE